MVRKGRPIQIKGRPWDYFWLLTQAIPIYVFESQEHADGWRTIKRCYNFTEEEELKAVYLSGGSEAAQEFADAKIKNSNFFDIINRYRKAIYKNQKPYWEPVWFKEPEIVYSNQLDQGGLWLLNENYKLTELEKKEGMCALCRFFTHRLSEISAEFEKATNFMLIAGRGDRDHRDGILTFCVHSVLSSALPVLEEVRQIEQK